MIALGDPRLIVVVQEGLEGDPRLVVVVQEGLEGDPRLVVVVQEGDARDNLFPPPPASLRRLKVTFTNFSVSVFWFKGSV